MEHKKEVIRQEIADGKYDGYITYYRKYLLKRLPDYRLCTYHNRSAEDLDSDLRLLALRSVEEYDASRSAFASFLFRVLQRRAVDILRKEYRRRLTPKRSGPNFELYSIADCGCTAQQLAQINELLHSLSSENRSTFTRLLESDNFTRVLSATRRKKVSRYITTVLAISPERFRALRQEVQRKLPQYVE